MHFAIKALLVVLVSLVTGILVLALAPLDHDGRLAYRLSRFWTWSILKIGGIRLRIEGLELLDPKRPYVFIANHQSNIDIPVLVQSLAQFQLRWAAKKELLRVPVFGWALRASRHIIVDRSNRAKAMASLRRAREILQSGLSVVFFPEGTRSSGGELLPFKRGGFVLAIKTRTPIVPVTIKGSRSVLPKGDWRIRPGEIVVIVSQPIPLDQPYAGRLGNLVSHVREVMEAHARQNGGASPKAPEPALAFSSSEAVEKR